MSIAESCLVVFVTQLIFIGCRTWNVKAIANNNIIGVMVSGSLVHISWLVSIAIGTVSMSEILTAFNYSHIPVVFFSLMGGLLGTWIAMKK